LRAFAYGIRHLRRARRASTKSPINDTTPKALDHFLALSAAWAAQSLPCTPLESSPRTARSAFVPASVIGPVRGPRSASTSLSARVAGHRRSACPLRVSVPRVEDVPTPVPLLRGLAMYETYRGHPVSNPKPRAMFWPRAGARQQENENGALHAEAPSCSHTAGGASYKAGAGAWLRDQSAARIRPAPFAYMLGFAKMILMPRGQAG